MSQNNENNVNKTEVSDVKQRRIERRNRRNARIARGRFFKNLFIWLLGVIFLPIAMVAAMFVVPIGAITGKNEVVSEELSKKSVFEVVKFAAGNYEELGFSDFPIIAKSLDDLADQKIIDDKKFKDVVVIDTEKLNTIKFGDSDLMEKIQSCVEIVANLDTFGGADLLGEFGTLSVFKEDMQAGTVSEILAKGENAETRLQYFYKTADGQFNRAFDKDGNPVDGLKGSDMLYYPALSKIKLSDLAEIFGAAFGRTTVRSLLKIFGIESTEEHPNAIVDILGTDEEGNDRTISGLRDFDFYAIKLSSVIKVEDAEDLYNILEEILNKDRNEITIGDLRSGNFNFNDIPLETVLKRKTAGEEGYEQNKQLWEVIDQTITFEGEKVTVGDLAKGFDIESLRLDVILKEEGNESLWEIIRAAVSKDYEGAEPVTVGDLINRFDLNEVPLKVVIKEKAEGEEGYAQNKQLWDILKQAIPHEGAYITIGDMLKGFDVEGIQLNTVLDEEENADLWNILRSAVGKDGEGAEPVTIGDLKRRFDLSKIPLKAVLKEKQEGEEGYELNKRFWDIIKSAVILPEGQRDITLGDLYSRFDMDEVPLNIVLDGIDVADNSVLLMLKEKNIKVGMIGGALNDLSLYEVYGSKAFTTTPIEGARRFRKGTYDGRVCFDQDTTGEYYLDNNAGIWLILCYDTATYNEDGTVAQRFSDSNGNPVKY
ncbi:MAG: hypothetical protein J5911_01030, partial [Clostridia bacterium]|nr:hypothetical protein [Clostridia bacterium]